MNSFTPGIIIALLIMFLIGILVGYSLVQRRLRTHAEELKVTRRRLDEMAQSHELRLREATDQLRHDYEAELSETIEHYQDQLSQKTIEMEQIYETRFRVLQQGSGVAAPQSLATANTGLSAVPPQRSPVAPPPRQGIEPIAGNSSAGLTPPELQHLKRQYELRLKEAAQKLQKAYETQLAEHAKTTKAELKADYERQVAAKYQEFERQFAARQAELEQQLASSPAESPTLSSMMTGSYAVPTPSEIMGRGEDTTVTLASSTPPELGEPVPPVGQYTQHQVDEQVQAATEQVQAELEQRLAEQLATQQAQFDRRLRELEAEYARLAAIPETTTPQTSADLVDDLDEIFGDAPPAPATTEMPTMTNEDESLVADNPLEMTSGAEATTNNPNDDDDDFGPLDLSDISQLT